jgi:hypothetical protein
VDCWEHGIGAQDRVAGGAGGNAVIWSNSLAGGVGGTDPNDPVIP